MKSDKKISICIPVYNGANTIAELVEELIEKLLMYEIEIILINDGSNDDSEKICIDLYNRFELIKFISLRKNFGEHNAVLCGLNYS